MDYITCTDEIKSNLQIDSCSMVRNQRNVAVILNKISDEGAIIGCPVTQDFKTFETFKLVFNCLTGINIVDVEVVNTHRAGGVILCEVKYRSQVLQKLKSDIETLSHNLEYAHKRKERRVLFTNDTIQSIGIDPHTKIVFNHKELSGYVRDISVSGISLFTDNNEIMKENGDYFFIPLKCKNPTENILLEGTILRKEVVPINSAQLNLIVFLVKQNLKFTQRISNFLNTLEKNVTHSKGQSL